jgi:hypothetical protein
MAISATVWRKGWRREAAATQDATQTLAAFIQWCEQNGYHEIAANVRAAAMHDGAQQAARRMLRFLAARWAKAAA